ncbi:uncharacterized protein LOC120299952 [Crotalus tigris]|uniref:uncharacterized protein LOC120299952 n=1 Tax=Crotalus tigris TaxID=88082 RepID=UPI00192FAEE6|nr:uncharacterized protein LOC120299952 [Crotalus tigris]
MLVWDRGRVHRVEHVDILRQERTGWKRRRRPPPRRRHLSAETASASGREGRASAGSSAPASFPGRAGEIFLRTHRQGRRRERWAGSPSRAPASPAGSVAPKGPRLARETTGASVCGGDGTSGGFGQLAPFSSRELRSVKQGKPVMPRERLWVSGRQGPRTSPLSKTEPGGSSSFQPQPLNPGAGRRLAGGKNRRFRDRKERPVGTSALEEAPQLDGQIMEVLQGSPESTLELKQKRVQATSLLYPQHLESLDIFFTSW